MNLYGYVGNDPIDAIDPLGLWSFYKWLYTGFRDGNAPDDVYQAGVQAAAVFWQNEGGIRGLSAGLSINLNPGAVRGNFSFGGAVDVDSGISRNGSLGVNVNYKGVESVTGSYGLNQKQDECPRGKGGFGYSNRGGRLSNGVSGGTARPTLGFSMSLGSYVSLNVGFIIDTQKAGNNIGDSIIIIQDMFGPRKSNQPLFSYF